MSRSSKNKVRKSRLSREDPRLALRTTEATRPSIIMVQNNEDYVLLGSKRILARRSLFFGLVGVTFTVSLDSSYAEEPPAHANALPARLRALLSDFRKCPGISADFSEEKNIVLLSAPLKASGKIYFHPPHSLARVVESPRKSHVVVTGKKIIIKEDNVRKEVDFSDKPALRGLISSLLHILAGDAERLTADYEAQFVEEGVAGWRLVLIPKKEELRRLVASLTFSGKALKLSELRVKEANGDETVTRFSNVNEKRKFTKAEVAQYFEI